MRMKYPGLKISGDLGGENTNAGRTTKSIPGSLSGNLSPPEHVFNLQGRWPFRPALMTPGLGLQLFQERNELGKPGHTVKPSQMLSKLGCVRLVGKDDDPVDRKFPGASLFDQLHQAHTVFVQLMVRILTPETGDFYPPAPRIVAVPVIIKEIAFRVDPAGIVFCLQNHHAVAANEYKVGELAKIAPHGHVEVPQQTPVIPGKVGRVGDRLMDTLLEGIGELR